ncbi:MAG: hypothetical protein LUC98_14405 [Lachnospiraceae bacterium]|nr:hypothetical protein [Lachnospiraceae bacterium]
MKKGLQRCLWLLPVVVLFCLVLAACRPPRAERPYTVSLVEESEGSDAEEPEISGLAQGILTMSGAMIIILASGLYLYLLGGKKKRPMLREGSV